jgi:hypothetical protein
MWSKQDLSAIQHYWNWFIHSVSTSVKKISNHTANALNSQIVSSIRIKRIVTAGVIIYCCFTVQYLTNLVITMADNIRNEADKPVLNNKIKEMKNITVRVSFHSKILKMNNIHSTEFSGEYEEVLAISLVNNTIQIYAIEEIYFVLGTNTKRILNTIHYLKFWAKLTGIKCLIVFEERYFELFHSAWHNQESNEMHTGRKQVQWFAVGDDDSVWFVNNLLHTLQQYNSTNSVYLGDISDKTRQISRHGDFFAYGGGGILLSRPLALLFAQHIQECKRFIHESARDAMIGKCVTEVLKVNLTKNKNFHQMDHIGDMTGLFESGIDGLVTVHHMFSIWKPFPDGHSNKTNETMYLLELAYTTFRKTFLKRYVRVNHETNQTLLLTTGYSFSLFDRILSHVELTQVENTWCCSKMVARQTRPKENNKHIWYFRGLTTKTLNGSIRYEVIYEKQEDMYGQIPSMILTLTN